MFAFTTRLVGLVLALLVAAPLGLADEEIVKEFKKYFRKYKDTPIRVEAILSLEGTETTSVVSALVPVLKDKESEVVNAAIRILAGFETRPPIDAMLARLEKEKAEAVRVGLLRAMSDGGYTGTSEIVVLCLEDRAWDVRRRAVQALAATRDATYVDVIAPLCADGEVAVRCAAIQGLADLGSDRVRGPAVNALEDESWQVRATAISALGRIRHKDSIGPLIEQMKVEEGRLKEDVGKSLESLTGRAFGTRIELWERFWGNYADRYEIPTDAELAALRAKQAERKAEYEKQNGVSYHGIETPSRSILFVIDVSGSMENEVVEQERFKDGDYPSFSRMDIVKTELARTIEGLESYVEFNILAFATEVKSWKKSLVKANVLNKSSAMDWALRLEPLGGASREELARVGLAGTANLEAGKTNTYEALAWALGTEGPAARKTGDDYEVAVDTIFFLSDGRPTHGRFIDPDDILREIAEVNALRKIVIHTIAIGEFQKTFMELLAGRNGGVFVDLGR